MANKRIRTTVYGTTTPLDKNVAWIDTTDASSPVLKLYVNGEWAASSGSGGGSSESNYIETTEHSWFWRAERTWTRFDTKAGLCEFIGISEEQLDSLLNGESRADLLAYWDYDGANMESILRYEKREYQEGVSLVQWLFYDAETYAFKEVAIMADEAYKVKGLSN